MPITFTVVFTDPMLLALGLISGLLAATSLLVSGSPAIPTLGQAEHLTASKYLLRRVSLAAVTAVLGMAGLALAPPAYGTQLAELTELVVPVSPWAVTVLQTGALAAAVCGATLMAVTVARQIAETWTRAALIPTPAAVSQAVSQPVSQRRRAHLPARSGK